MIGDFFIWCAGSDTSILKRCPRSERIKHMGFGTLVLIPAILAFVSMTYALSTVGQLQEHFWLALLGGIVWALIIFSFDRYIVSTHRRKLENKDEFKSPAFYLRFFFALILGIVISHPIVLLYFDGSINDTIEQNKVEHQKTIQAEYDARIQKIENQITLLDSNYSAKEKVRDLQAGLVAREIDGEVLKNAKGEIVTTGIYGKGPSAENKIQHLKQLDAELALLRANDSVIKSSLYAEITELKDEADSNISAYKVSFDYLRRELALEQMKEEHAIVGMTQAFLMLLFILVDILPVTFKTFSPFGMYDKILMDDSKIVKELKSDDRATLLQKAYQKLNADFASENQI
ncbi:DUF4407 domain-containing protein [Owenweeksia hongkongensis]|uniref:DUF4407 domain-containing protein n=1 Tax=Owenweeksia hongkongensis TaxID=253245 RepID=UPI003A95A9F7